MTGEEDTMPFPGEIKKAYCPFCHKETEWEYVLLQLEDGYFGLENAILPEHHQVKFWRCREHTTSQGRIREELKPKAKPVPDHG